MAPSLPAAETEQQEELCMCADCCVLIISCCVLSISSWHSCNRCGGHLLGTHARELCGHP